MKNKYCNLWLQVNRPGVKEFLEWLDGTGFYSAPCSTRYHLSREGGLLEHSLNIYESLTLNSCHYGPTYGLQINQESLIICGLGHDICKADFYGQEMRNVKIDGTWVQRPFYTVKDKLPYGHGEKSVLLLQRFIKLKLDEVMAIRWHMGGFTPGMHDYGTAQAFSEAAKRIPLVILLHIADMESTYLKEDKEDVSTNQSA